MGRLLPLVVPYRCVSSRDFFSTSPTSLTYRSVAHSHSTWSSARVAHSHTPTLLVEKVDSSRLRMHGPTQDVFLTVAPRTSRRPWPCLSSICWQRTGRCWTGWSSRLLYSLPRGIRCAAYLTACPPKALHLGLFISRYGMVMQKSRVLWALHLRLFSQEPSVVACVPLSFPSRWSRPRLLCSRSLALTAGIPTFWGWHVLCEIFPNTKGWRSMWEVIR